MLNSLFSIRYLAFRSGQIGQPISLHQTCQLRQNRRGQLRAVQGKTCIELNQIGTDQYLCIGLPSAGDATNPDHR